jgi:branched-chain amino acid transport system ATP-binding protein
MLLEINNLEVLYNEVILVLKGLSLAVPEGRIVALLGSNGAGKTTTLRAISGLLRHENGEVTQGSIAFRGARIDGRPAHEIVRRGIVQVMEGRGVFDELTVEDNLRAGTAARARGRGVAQDLEKVYAYFPVLEARRRQVAGYLSGGEQQMLVIGRALMARPSLLLLDEPSLGLAPLVVEELFGIVRRINRDEGAGILLVEQNAQMALEIADHGYVMEGGRIVLDGPAAELRDNRNVREFYLGLTAEGTLKSYRDVKHYVRRKRWFSS